MDHGDQFEREGKVMAQVQMGRDYLCDNLPNPEALTIQTQSLNQTTSLSQTQSFSLLQKEDEGGRGPFQKDPLSNNGNGREEEQNEEEKEGNTGGIREEDDEEDIDEEMKEDNEEEEVSEGSSSLICCQCPDTPMTDSSFSETGSLLGTPYPFSPGTSPEPISPVMPLASPETPYPISQVALSQSVVSVKSFNTDSVASDTGSIALGQIFTTGPGDCPTQTMTSDCRSHSPPKSTFITEVTEHLNSFTESVFSYGLKCDNSNAGHSTSTAETFTVTAGSSRLDASICCTPSNAAPGPLTFITRSINTGAESTSSTGPTTSKWEQITSMPVPALFSVSTCARERVPNPDLLESLEKLAQRGDDTHLPEYLHQIAEAFVLDEDYQRALWCIQLERLYHQRVLDNLNALQEQWESYCTTTSPDLTTQHLDSLKHICQTHNRPRAEDAVCASLAILRPTSEEGGELLPCTSVGGGMEQRAEDSSHSQRSHPFIPSHNLADGKDREDPETQLEGRAGFCGSELIERQARDGVETDAEGGVGYTVSAVREKLHPSATGAMEQSKSAEQQGGDLGHTQEREAKREVEERDEEAAVEALEMEVEGEDEDEDKLKGGDASICQKAPTVETVVSGTDEEEEQLHQEALTVKLHDKTQVSCESPLYQEAKLPQEVHMKQQEQAGVDEDYYEVEQADIIREAASLDDMAKLITVEEMSPAFGLVSILKKRSTCMDNASGSASSEPQPDKTPDKTPDKRRVRFRVPDDCYEHDVGGGDSCLLLFLLCLVTVVISLGGTALYCALGDAQSSVCQDFSRNADFYIGQLQRGISHIQHWFTPGS